MAILWQRGKLLPKSGILVVSFYGQELIILVKRMVGRFTVLVLDF